MIPESLSPLLLCWLLTYLVHSTLLVALIALVTRCLPKAAMGAREALWKLALIGGLGSASIQLACSSEPWCGSLPLAEAPTETPPAADLPSVLAQPSLEEISSSEAALVPFEGLDTLQAEAAAAPAAVEERSALTAWLARARAADWRLLVLGAWFGGALLGLVALLRAWRRLQRTLRWRTPLVSGPLREQLDELCAEVGHRGRIRLSCASEITEPVAFGALRPEICVPLRAIARLSPAQQRSMLAHELAHVLRCDPSWLLGTRVLEALLFVQPLNRLARRGLEDASEYLCDDFAARRGGGLALASCLAEIAGWLVPQREQRSLALAVGMARAPSRLSHRIERLLVEEQREERLAWLTPVGLSACSLLVFVAPGFRPGSAESTEPAEEPSPRGEAAPAGEASEPEPVTDALSALGAEIETLTGEIDALRAELASRGLTQRFAAQLSTLETRLSELSTRRARLHQVLGALAALTTAAQNAPPTDPLAAPSAATNP